MKLTALPVLFGMSIGCFLFSDGYSFVVTAALTLLPFVLTKQIDVI